MKLEIKIDWGVLSQCWRTQRPEWWQTKHWSPVHGLPQWPPKWTNSKKDNFKWVLCIEGTTAHILTLHMSCLYSSTRPLCTGRLSLSFCVQHLVFTHNYSKWCLGAIWNENKQGVCSVLKYIKSSSFKSTHSKYEFLGVFHQVVRGESLGSIRVAHGLPWGTPKGQRFFFSPPTRVNHRNI